MSKNYYEEIVRTVDQETGEVVEVQQKVKRRVEKDKFAMMYLKDISGILELNSKGEYKVMLSLVQRSHYNTNEVRIMKDVKLEIAQEVGLSYNSIRKSIISLTKKKIIVRKRDLENNEVKGVYILNPKFFFKGEDVERTKIIKLVLEYELI